MAGRPPAIVQSFRTTEVPDWIARCLASVRDWAEARGHPYTFVDDALFDRAPAWYRAKVGHAVLPVSDLARLMLLREVLVEHPAAAWIDADVLVFDPDRFHLPDVPYALSPERWVFRTKAGQLRAVDQVNNSVMVFARRNPFLEFYIEACQTAVRAAGGEVASHLVGTDLLTDLDRVVPLVKLDSVGMISPALARDLAADSDRAPRFYAEGLAQPVRAANLCLSFAGRPDPTQRLRPATFEATVERLLASRGEAINRWLPTPG
jgi:hypothetical protein